MACVLKFAFIYANRNSPSFKNEKWEMELKSQGYRVSVCPVRKKMNILFRFLNKDKFMFMSLA